MVILYFRFDFYSKAYTMDEQCCEITCESLECIQCDLCLHRVCDVDGVKIEYRTVCGHCIHEVENLSENIEEAPMEDETIPPKGKI